MTETQSTPGTVIDTPSSAKAERVREHLRQLATVQAADANDAADIEDRQVVGIMSATTIDEAWGADEGGAIQARDAVGLEVEIRSFRMLIGNDPGKKTRSGTYATADAVCMGGPADLMRKLGLAPGTEFALQTGAEKIVMKWLKFQQLDALPVRGVIAGIETNSGNTVLKFVRPPVRTV